MARNTRLACSALVLAAGFSVFFRADSASAAVRSHVFSNGGGKLQNTGATLLLNAVIGETIVGSAAGSGVNFRAGLSPGLEAPTPVLLLGFSARWSDGSVLLTWQVADTDNLVAGFHVYAGLTGDSPENKLTGAPLVEAGAYTFLDETPPTPEAFYWLEGILRSGESVWYGPVEARTAGRPLPPHLRQNAPNPVTGSTVFSFDLPAPATVSLDVFDLQGRLVAHVAGGEMPAGRSEVPWEGTGSSGAPLPAGTYFYVLKTPEVELTHRLVLLR